MKMLDQVGFWDRRPIKVQSVQVEIFRSGMG